MDDAKLEAYAGMPYDAAATAMMTEIRRLAAAPHPTAADFDAVARVASLGVALDPIEHATFVSRLARSSGVALLLAAVVAGLLVVISLVDGRQWSALAGDGVPGLRAACLAVDALPLILLFGAVASLSWARRFGRTPATLRARGDALVGARTGGDNQP